MKTPFFTFAVAALFALTSCSPEQIIEPTDNGNLTEGGKKAIFVEPVQKEFPVNENDHASLGIDRSGNHFEPSVQAELFLWSEGILHEEAMMELTEEADYWIQTEEATQDPHVEMIYEELSASNHAGSFLAHGIDKVVAIYNTKTELEKEEGLSLQAEVVTVAAEMAATGYFVDYHFGSFILRGVEQEVGANGFSRVDVSDRETGQTVSLYFK